MMPYKKSGRQVGGTGCRRKEQILRSWKSLTTGHPNLARRSRLAQGQGAADLMAYASAAGPLLLRN